MNQKEFKSCMQKGLGRCHLALKSSDNIEKYKSVVLWGCLHNLSFDTQCEGTRADYVYGLTTYFNDVDYFLTPIVEAFCKLPKSHYWEFSHFVELLKRFAQNGNDRALLALKEEYESLLSALLNKRKYLSYDFERDCFELLCINLSSLGGKAGFSNTLSDIAELFANNTHYSAEDFEWFFLSAEEELGLKAFSNLLKSGAGQNENISKLYKQYLELSEERNSFTPQPAKALGAEDIESEILKRGRLSAASRVKFARRSGEDERIKLAEAIIKESDINKKAEMLSAMTGKDFPLSHKPIIEYSKSENESLRECAFLTLTSCKSAEVREYALELLAKGERRTEAIEMLICNYTSADKALLLNDLNKLKIDYEDSSNWHTIGLKILEAYDNGVRLPADFLLYIYNSTLCSCCRSFALGELAKRRRLTDDIIEECRYDSNEDIVKYVNRYYKKRKSN